VHTSMLSEAHKVHLSSATRMRSLER